MTPLFEKHMDDIISGEFSTGMMKDWNNDDIKLLNWREETGNTNFEKTPSSSNEISTSEYFENGIVMIAFIKSGVELAFETMVSAGIKDESAYYESLHELPLIANLVARKKLYEMNSIISDTAEYGCYLFANKAKPLLYDFIECLDHSLLVKGSNKSHQIDDELLKKINFEINNHPVEKIGLELRKSMTAMKNLF
jgi:ketol-acid reductoisomerase